MNKQVEELVERVRLTDEEIAQVYFTKSKPSLIDAKGVLHPDYERAFCEAQLNKVLKEDLALRIKCPHCVWWQFEGESVGMTPCYECNSSGYIYEALKELKNEPAN